MKVIGTQLYEKGFETLIKEFKELLQHESTNYLISPSDANVLVEARTNNKLRDVLNQFYWNLPDGVPSVWVMKLKGCKQVNRCSGPDFFKRIMIDTATKPVNHYFLGGKEGVAKGLKNVCKSWGNSNVVATLCPPFKVYSEQEIQDIASHINDKKTDILWVGLGAPKQIYFAHRIAKYTNIKAIVTIGAAFDFHVGNVKKAPNWIQNIGMEWFFRLLQEPKRLFKRYLNVVPKFIYYNLIDR